MLYTAPSPVHGTGVFAAVDLPKSKLLGIYTGEIIDRETARERIMQDYIFGLGRGRYMDGNPKLGGSILSFINHGDFSNVHVRICKGDVIKFYTKKVIPAGTELFFNYGYDPKIYDYVY